MNLHLFLDVVAWGMAVLATGFCWAAIPARRPIVEFVLSASGPGSWRDNTTKRRPNETHSHSTTSHPLPAGHRLMPYRARERGSHRRTTGLP